MNTIKSECMSKIKSKLVNVQLLNKQIKLDNWIIGLINAEGYFYLANSIKKTKAKLNFVIEHTDEWALLQIKRILDLNANII